MSYLYEIAQNYSGNLVVTQLKHLAFQQFSQESGNKFSSIIIKGHNFVRTRPIDKKNNTDVLTRYKSINFQSVLNVYFSFVTCYKSKF